MKTGKLSPESTLVTRPATRTVDRKILVGTIKCPLCKIEIFEPEDNCAWVSHWLWLRAGEFLICGDCHEELTVGDRQ